LAKPMLWLVARSSNCVVAVSAYIQHLLAPTLRSEILYDYFAGVARTPKKWAATDAKIIVMIGNYIHGKGQDVALAAFIEAAEKDATLRLHFYGGALGLQKKRDYRAQLEATAKQSACAHRIVFHDTTRDGAAVLATAYAALNFSQSESFSMTVMEACGAGVPVIATRSGGPQEIVVDGATGYLIAVGDVAAARDAMAKLAANPAQAARMGQAGAAHVAERFSAKAYGEGLREVLRLG
jgi:L-malate glycosyltransferase